MATGGGRSDRVLFPSFLLSLSFLSPTVSLISSPQRERERERETVVWGEGWRWKKGIMMCFFEQMRHLTDG